MWHEDRRRAADRCSLIKFSVFALVTILATALLAATIVNISFAPEHRYRAVFSDVTGLEEGDDIRVAGVRVGEIEGIRIKDRTLAEVTFTVGQDRPLLTSTGAVIRYRNLVGQRYVALTEGTGDGTRLLRPGATIPLARTQPALDLNALLNGFKPCSPRSARRTSTSSPPRSSRPSRARVAPSTACSCTRRRSPRRWPAAIS